MYKIVDADSHVLEPANLWEENLEPKYRDRAIHLRKDEHGREYVEIDGRKPERSYFLVNGMLARDVGVSLDAKERQHYMSPDGPTYEEGLKRCAAAHDPHERVKVLDREGIDVSVLYNNWGLSWEEECHDPKLAAAYARVYNNWVIDFCKPYPNRLIPIAHIPLHDVEEGVKELRRAVKLGAKGAHISAEPLHGIAYGDPYYDPFWAEAQGLDVPVTLHPRGPVKFMGGDLYPEVNPDVDPTITWWMYGVGLQLFEMVVGFASLITRGALDRFPRLKVVLLETGIAWLPYYLHRMDSFKKHLSWSVPSMRLLPSEYFQRQCWISMEPDDTTVSDIAHLVGADRILWAADYPHSDAGIGVVTELKENLESLRIEDQAKVIGENAMKIYRLA